MDQYMKELSMQLARPGITQHERLNLVQKALLERTPTAEEVRLKEARGNARKSAKRKGNTTEKSVVRQILDLSSFYGLPALLAARMSERMMDGLLPSEDEWSYPIRTLSCSNIRPEIHRRCPEIGNHACASCFLVSYCSKECQKAHWGVHKLDCKHMFNSKDWEPAWMREKREPVFKEPLRSASDKRRKQGHNPVGCGIDLWGNVPAINILKLEQNEGLPYQEDLSLAFPASGDLRNVIMTINSIPADYTGKIFVAINDVEARVSARNLLLLLAISRVRDKDLAADIALHLWYSAFIPKEYNQRIAAFATWPLSATQNDRMDWRDNRLRVVADHTPLLSDLMKSYLHPQDSLDPDEISLVYSRVMWSPDRVDYHERYYCQLKPAHRLSMRHFRNHGVVLPVRAADLHFNTPNVTLFTKGGQWLQDDMNSPLSGWNLIDVIATGKAHGVREEDIFGCLYFYLSEKLIEFKAKLSSLDITFYLSSMDSQELAANIKASSNSSTDTILNHPYPPGLPTKFDRIDMSDTVDDAYVGYERSLADWGPLLNASNPHATLLAHSMNWAWKCEGGLASDDDTASKRIKQEFMREKIKSAAPSGVSFPVWAAISEVKFDAGAPAMYDNSKAFEDYLQERNVLKAATDLGLQMQSEHKITPPRHGVPLEAPASALPHFPDEEAWYREVYLSRYSFYTRFQEFRRSTTQLESKESR